MKPFDFLKQTKVKSASADKQLTPEASELVSQAPVPPENLVRQATSEMTCWRCARRLTDRLSPSIWRILPITCPYCASIQPAPEVRHSAPQPAVKSDQPPVPTCIKHVNWQTFVRIDLNALPSDDTLIVIASDFDELGCSLAASHRLRRVGHAIFESSTFGWMNRRKTGTVFCIDRNSPVTGDALQTVVENFKLQPSEYQPTNIAFLTETCEKDYSIEIAAITGIRVEVLCRYCNGTSNEIEKYHPPRLISLMLDE